jgi:hypothetical protein
VLRPLAVSSLELSLRTRPEQVPVPREVASRQAAVLPAVAVASRSVAAAAARSWLVPERV